MDRSIRHLLLLGCWIFVLFIVSSEAKTFRLRSLVRSRRNPNKVIRRQLGALNSRILTRRGGKFRIQKCGPILGTACAGLANHCHSSVLSKRSITDKDQKPQRSAFRKRMAKKLKRSRRRRRCRQKKNCRKRKTLRRVQKPKQPLKVTCGVCRSYCW
ncbi:uncharacterized protein LOC100187420 [Ciona intestinalis]